jgi:transglutaminase-like putative cysteine protease
VTTLTVTGQLPVYDDVESVTFNGAAMSGGTYRVLASSSTATGADLRSAGKSYPDWVVERYLSLPETITPRTVDLTRSITAASDTPYDRARAIEQYLRNTIVYDETVDAPPGDADIVDYLLFERNRGYCEYSASAMTVMLRSIGIPARVAVGFYPGSYDQAQAGYLYRQYNAHAWTEAFFPGYGWISFEPTSSRPLIDPATGNADDGQPLPEPTMIAEMETPVPGTPTAEASPAVPMAEGGTVTPPQPTPADGSGRFDRGIIIGSVVVTALVVAGSAWFFWSFPLRGMSPSSSLFARLHRLGRWFGVAPSATSTPSEYGRAFAERVPHAQPHVERIVQSYELDQFGPERASAQWVGTAQESWNTMKQQAPRWFLRRRS